MLPKVTDIINFFENEFADVRKQSQWDFSGAQVFANDRLVSKIAISLDANEDNVKNAINAGCELLLTHHPLFFRQSKGINCSREADKIAVTAIKGGLDILSYHTNLDIADDGTSAYLCKLLGFQPESGFIAKEGVIGLFKIHVYVPKGYVETVSHGMFEAGAGAVGEYTACGFYSHGEGSFIPSEKATPFIGSQGSMQRVEEVKVEVVTDERYLNSAVKAMIAKHPYEEPAYGVTKLENGMEYGFGKVCNLNKEFTLKEFIELLKLKLPSTIVRTNLEDTTPFSKIGVCTGSGASMWKDCLKKGVRVLLTGDMKYHDAVDAANNGVCIVDAGHQATEEIYTYRLKTLIEEKFKIKTYVINQKNQIISWE